MGLATGRRCETDLLTRGLGGLFPEAWAKFRDGVPEEDRDGDLADAYYKLLIDPDPAVHDKAARDWCAWEDAIIPTSPPCKSFQEPAFRLAFARLVTHYWRQGSFLDEGVVLREAKTLAHIPAVLAEGSLDLGNLVGTPWVLAHAWPGSELVLIDEVGHSTQDEPMREVLIGATDRFAS